MKKILFILAAAFLVNQLNAQELVQLPEPDKNGGEPLMKCLNERKSSRDYSEKALSQQQLSNLLWAAYGYNRPEDEKRTVPTSRNIQDIELYVFSGEGVFLYDAKAHGLKKILGEDQRKVTGKQPFVKDAAINLVYVSDFDKHSGNDAQGKKVTASVHCGFIGQNVYLYCASEGLSSVFRAWIDPDKIAETLNLPGNKHVMYSQTVGLPKED